MFRSFLHRGSYALFNIHDLSIWAIWKSTENIYNWYCTLEHFMLLFKVNILLLPTKLVTQNCHVCPNHIKPDQNISECNSREEGKSPLSFQFSRLKEARREVLCHN